MKAVICAALDPLHIFSFNEKWTYCQCRWTAARWIDPQAGTMAVAARDRDAVRVLGLNNHLLLPAFRYGGSWEDFRGWHDKATDAPAHVFDKSRAGCWAVVFRVGSTGDTRWVTEEEYLEVFPS